MQDARTSDGPVGSADGDGLVPAVEEEGAQLVLDLRQVPHHGGHDEGHEDTRHDHREDDAGDPHRDGDGSEDGDGGREADECSWSTNNTDWTIADCSLAGSDISPPSGEGDNLQLYVRSKYTDEESYATTNVQYTYDTTSPSITLTSFPDQVTSLPNATFEFYATEALSEPVSFECKLDDGAFSDCVSPASFTNLGIGQHTFTVRSSDGASNTSSDTTYTWTITANTNSDSNRAPNDSLAGTGQSPLLYAYVAGTLLIIGAAITLRRKA